MLAWYISTHKIQTKIKTRIYTGPQSTTAGFTLILSHLIKGNK